MTARFTAVGPRVISRPLLSWQWGSKRVELSTAVSAQTVFRPNSFPNLTYVQRARGYDEDLSEALKRAGTVVSLTGPSKSGKTVLTQKVVGPANACVVSCGDTPSADRFWQEVLRQLKLGVAEESEEATQEARSRTIAKGGAIGIPGVIGGQAQVETGTESLSGRTEKQTRILGASDAVQALLDSGRTLVLDDFHYLSGAAQREIGRQLKAAAFREVPIVILSVPHHDEDPVEVVPDIGGRVLGVKLSEWSPEELTEIATKGFAALNVDLQADDIHRLAIESIGSPQLMQLLCLETCSVLGITTPLPARRHEVLTGGRFGSIFSRASRATKFANLFKKLQTGPAERGPLRTKYKLADGTSGDIYRVTLAALASDPVERTLSYTDLRKRAESACIGEQKPPGQNVQGTIERMSKIAKQYGGAGSGQRDPAIEWMAERRELVLPDAYFLFYLRWEAFPNHDAFTRGRG